MEPEGSLPHSLSVSSPSRIQSMPPHPTSWRSILILSSHLGLGLPSSPFPQAFSPNPVYSSPGSPTCYMPRHHTVLDFIIRTTFSEQYRPLSSSLCSFLHSPVTSALLGPNILLCPLFSNTLSIRSSLNVNDQVSHPYKTTGIIIIIIIIINWQKQPNLLKMKVHIISTHQPMYWRMNISSCTGIAAYLRTKQYLSIDLT